ncbi:MAG: hypothetical protein WDA59_09120 [Methanofastidiosum sp.]
MTVLQKMQVLKEGMEKCGVLQVADILQGMVDELQTGITAIMEKIEEGQFEDALECCADLI